MPGYTENLNLRTTDMESDGDELFDFEVDLNGNFEKIDARFSDQDISLLSTGWVGSSAPYSQTINIEGMTADINPHVSLNQSSDYETAMSEIQEFSKIYKGESGAGTITFYAMSPTGIDLSLKVKRL